jgi:two-component system phosphate regulon sensor histidine kinase PhoR
LAREILDAQVASAAEIGDERAGDRVIGVAGTPVPGEDGADGAVLVLRDITEARRAASLGRELVANASHELRTPLAIVESSADTLLGSADGLPEDLRPFLEIISRNSRRMARLVSETLELSKLEAGWQAEPDHADLGHLARRAVEQCQPLAEEKGVLLQVGTLVLAPVSGSETQLFSALRNLVENAVHYTPSGGRVTVRSRIDGTDVEFSVADTGPGIPEADHKRIFERFYRGDEAALKRAEGSGLGLAIVRRVAELHGGSVRVESTLGSGSTFFLRVPLDS